MNIERLEERLSIAVAQFWSTRDKQQESVGGDTTQEYAGTRGAVVGGGHLKGFFALIRELLVEGGLPDACIYPTKKSAANKRGASKPGVLPGFYRATKQWDLVVVSEGKLIATLEFKSQVGSVGNNFNNRVEEALGNATDLHTAYREGAFAPSPAPWMGWLMVCEDCEDTSTPVRVSEPHFKVFNEWRGTSYAKRYELFCQKLVRERLYNAACLLVARRDEAEHGIFHEPCAEVDFRTFASSLIGHATGIAKLQGKT